MGKIRRSFCRDCGASGNETHISKQGYCAPCGTERLLANNRQLQQGHGPAYDAWAVTWAAAAVAIATAAVENSGALDQPGHRAESAPPPAA